MRTKGKLKITNCTCEGGRRDLRLSDGTLVGCVKDGSLLHLEHLVNCWNAFEKDGLVGELVKALRMVSNSVFQDNDGEWQLSRPVELLQIIADEAIEKAGKL